MFNRLSISLKLTAAFTTVALLTLALGISGYSGSLTLSKDLETISEFFLVGIKSLGQVTLNLERLSAATRGLLNPGLAAKTLEARLESIHTAQEEAAKGIDAFEKLSLDPQDNREWETFTGLLNQWKTQSETTRTIVAEWQTVKKNPETPDYQSLEAYQKLERHVTGPVAEAEEKALNQLKKIVQAFHDESVKAGQKANTDMAFVGKFSLMGRMGAGFVLSLLLGLISARNINSTIRDFMTEMNQLTEAAQAGKLATRGSLDKIHFEFHPLMTEINRTLDAIIEPLNVSAAHVDRIAKGDIPEKITQDYFGDFTKIKDNLNLLIEAMNVITQASKQIAQGNLTVELNKRSANDELMTALTDMVSQLSKIISEICNGIQTLATSSSELSAISLQMSNRTREVAGKSSGVAVATEELNTNTTSVASNMEKASTNLTTVATSTEEMTATIGEIAANSEKAREITVAAVTQSTQISTRMKDLGKLAQEIGNFTETITSISAQTNMLALNATIEAARAGSAGRGFAVVANEIKELAKQAAAASEDIKARISGIQNSTVGAIGEIEKIGSVILEVNEIVTATATAIDQQSTVTREIARNIVLASAGFQDSSQRVSQTSIVLANISKDILAMNASTGEIEAASKNVNTSAQELSKLSEQLKEMISRFAL